MSAYWLLVPLLLPIFGGAALGIIKPHSRMVMEITVMTVTLLTSACVALILAFHPSDEAIILQLAEKLSAYYDVTVYTTCAKDYITWANEYPAGTEEINGIHVRRFPVRKERNQEEFAKLSRDKFLNRTIVDSIERNAHDPLRKIGPNERIMGPLRLILQEGGDGSVLEKTCGSTAVSPTRPALRAS